MLILVITHSNPQGLVTATSGRLCPDTSSAVTRLKSKPMRVKLFEFVAYINTHPLYFLRVSPKASNSKFEQ
jgi:hypothetical protein